MVLFKDPVLENILFFCVLKMDCVLEELLLKCGPSNKKKIGSSLLAEISRKAVLILSENRKIAAESLSFKCMLIFTGPLV